MRRLSFYIYFVEMLQFRVHINMKNIGLPDDNPCKINENLMKA